MNKLALVTLAIASITGNATKYGFGYGYNDYDYGSSDSSSEVALPIRLPEGD